MNLVIKIKDWCESDVDYKSFKDLHHSGFDSYNFLDFLDFATRILYWDLARKLLS